MKIFCELHVKETIRAAGDTQRAKGAAGTAGHGNDGTNLMF